MPTVESVVAMIRRNGRPMTLRRVRNNLPDVDLEVIGITHGAMPADIVSNITQLTSAITISPVELIAANAPPPQPTDRIIRDGRTQTIQSAEPVFLRGRICKYVLTVKG